MIYLASPYSHKDPDVQEARFRMACRAAAALMRKGLCIYSPVAHTHPIALAGDLPKGWDYWERFDRDMISHCEELWVLQLQGWFESKGVQAEIQIAREAQKKVVFIDPYFLAEAH